LNSYSPTDNFVALLGTKGGPAIRPGSIDLIFITHMHSDHYLELGPLLHTAWTAGLKHKVQIIGPAGIEDYWLAFLQSMKADIELRIEDEGRPNLGALTAIDRHVRIVIQKQNPPSGFLRRYCLSA